MFPEMQHLSLKADYDSCISSSSSANSRPPVLHVNGSLLVPLGGLAPLPLTLLQASDPDSPAEQLVFSLVQAASNGELLLFGEKGGGGGTEGREMNSGDTFGWAELKEGQVRFRHRRNRARSVRGLLLFSKYSDLGYISKDISVPVVSVRLRPLSVTLMFTRDVVKIHYPTRRSRK